MQSAAWTANAGQTQDTTFEFDVTADSPNLIKDITLTTAGAANFDGSWAVTETATPGSAAVTFQVTNPPPGSLVASIHKDFAPTPTVHVLKDIGLNGGTILTGPNPSFAAISRVDQTFSQVAAPSPASVTGGMAILLGLAFYRRLSR